jgi:uncharacterized protein (DUF1330 family)
MTDAGGGPIYALNWFNIADRDEYLAYARRSAAEVERHGGRIVALGRFSDAIKGEVEPRQVLILVEWRAGRTSTPTAKTPSWRTSIPIVKQAVATMSGTSSTSSTIYARC